jgi:hypothetical protein
MFLFHGKKAGNLLPQRLPQRAQSLCVPCVIFALLAVKKSQVYKLFISRPLGGNFAVDNLIVIFNKTTEMERIAQLAHKYDLPLGFTVELFDKVVDKENFESALQMFMSGAMTYDVAIGKQPINVDKLQTEVVKGLLVKQKRRLSSP